MPYHFIRVVVCLLTVVMGFGAVRACGIAIRETGELPPIAAVVVFFFWGLFAYWAWYVNAGRSRIQLWLAGGTLAAMTVAALGSFVHRANRDALNDVLFLLLLATYCLGIWLRQPRIRAIRLQDAQRAFDLKMLIAGLRDRSEFVRCHAARLLGEMGPDAVAALPELNKSRYDPSPHVRRAVAAAVERIAPRPGVAAPTSSAPSAAMDDNPYRSPAG